jgi:hypothetical protein
MMSLIARKVLEQDNVPIVLDALIKRFDDMSKR